MPEEGSQVRMKGGDASAHPGARQGAGRALSKLTRAELWREARQLPNLLTYLRLAAIPLFLWAYFEQSYALALILFAAAAVTDAVDGLIARAFQLRTALGGFIDPLADKLLNLSALVSLVLDDRLPFWLLAVVLLRDGAMLAGVSVLGALRVQVPAAPSRLGKYATLLLSTTVVLALASTVTDGPALDGYLAATALLSLQCVLATVVQYSVRWSHLMRSAQH